jgi:transcriptional regulator with XRE-family HTH domain
MQAISVTFSPHPYDEGMQTGRPSKRQRPPLGERIAALREHAGLSQQQLADKLGVNQQMIAYWERRAATLRPDQLTSLADALQTSVDQLLGKAAPKARGTGPSGKVRQTFEAVSRLPRRQQQRILATVEDMLIAQSAKNGH